MAATMLGKGVVAETHPLYIGLYEGALGREEVTKYVEESDCVLMLGTFMTDINLGIYTAKLDLADCIYATSEQLRDPPPSLPRRAAARISCEHLAARHPQPKNPPPPAPTDWRKEPFTLQPERADHDHAADRPARRAARRRDGRDRRHRRRAVRRDGADHPRPDRVHQPGLLHVDGLRRAGGAGRPHGPARSRGSWRSSATGRSR